MSDTHQDTPLTFDELAAPSADVWRAAAVESLVGKPFEKLITATYEGIPLQPLYGREDIAALQFAATLPGRPPYVRGARAAGYLAQPWAVAQELAYGRPAEFNRALLADLGRGQTAVNVVLDAATRAGTDPDAAGPGEVGRGGLSLASAEDMAEALRGVYLDAVPLFVHAGASALPLLALLVAHLRRAGKPLAELRGGLLADPLGALAEDGSLPVSLERAYDESAAVTRWAVAGAPGLATAGVNTGPYHEAGANAVQELAFALATGVAYLRALMKRGMSIDEAAPRLRFDFAIGGQFFMEIAKLRAARLLWAQVVAAFGGGEESQALRLHARTGRRNKSALDPYANMLRVTTEALAAAVGGTDSLHVAPFDEPVRPPDEFSRRIARNVQIILQEEAHLTQLIDPAGGSYAVEALTDALAREAWALFQEIERRGGMAAALQEGFIQSSIAAVADKRAAALAKRRDVLIGVNQFANAAEKSLPPDDTDDVAIHRERAAQLADHRANNDHAVHEDALARLALPVGSPEEFVEAAIAAAEAGATLGEIARALRSGDSGVPTVSPLRRGRTAEPFEALQARALDYASIHGHRPRLFLANLGPPRQHKARADFTQGFFEVGGFQVLTNNGFRTPQEAASAALASGAPAVAICSTDETYPELVPPLVAAVKAAAPQTVVILAGRPADQVDAHKAAGVDEFVYLGADAVALNSWLLNNIAV